MASFVAVPVLPVLAAPPPLPRRRAAPCPRATPSPPTPSDYPVPGFRRDPSESNPRTSFLAPNRKPRTATEALRDDISSTLTSLPAPPGSTPRRTPSAPVDLSRVDPGGALAGGVVALCMFAALWTVTNAATEFYAHQAAAGGGGGAGAGVGSMYVVRRISAVVRTVVITALAIGSGLCGMTGVGLVALGVRVGWGRVTGEFGAASSNVESE